jgi:hypothetical protein
MTRLYRSAHARQVAGRVGGVPVLSQPAPRISAECPLAKTFVTLERAKTATSHRHTVRAARVRDACAIEDRHEGTIDLGS